ncbi:MAG TPA: hypothetical protein VNJ04_11935 [Gemmatimonadaceae bacterium]|nr:hypothetical protein [Gemmatimonadaceae bacterium]
MPPTLVRETPILPDLESLDCAEAVDRAVETFGLANVVRALRLVCAVNGRAL